MGMCSLQLLCPGSSSPSQTSSDYSWHRDQDFQVKMTLRNCHTFGHNLRAIQPNSSQHSIHHDSSHHETKSCQWDTPVQIPEFLNLSLISCFQDRANQFSRFYPCANVWHLRHLWMFFCICPYSPYSFLCPHSWTMTCSVCPCQTIACLCSCVHCSLVENVLHRTEKHPSRGLDDPFPLPDERELTVSTSMGSDCPHDPVSLGLESRILQPNFASTYVTFSRRASSKVCKRLELSIKCFSSSTGNQCLQTSELDLIV